MPWWVVTGLMGWSKWFVLGIFVWLSAPVLAFGATLAAGSEERATATYRELMGVVGFALFAFPILSFAATLFVTAIKVSLVQSWANQRGHRVMGPRYDYRNVFRSVPSPGSLDGRRDDRRTPEVNRRPAGSEARAAFDGLDSEQVKAVIDVAVRSLDQSAR